MCSDYGGRVPKKHTTAFRKNSNDFKKNYIVIYDCMSYSISISISIYILIILILVIEEMSPGSSIITHNYNNEERGWLKHVYLI